MDGSEWKSARVVEEGIREDFESIWQELGKRKETSRILPCGKGVDMDILELRERRIGSIT